MNRRAVLAIAMVALAVAVVLDRTKGTAPAVVGVEATLPAVPVALVSDSPAETVSVDRRLATLAPAARDPFHPAAERAPAPAMRNAPQRERPPLPPAAPPVPFQYLGAITGPDGRPAHYLTRDAAMIPIEVGTVLDAVWRVEAIAASEVQLTYLPLAQVQRLAIASP